MNKSSVCIKMNSADHPSAISDSSFYYSVNMLKLLKGMNLITEDEAERMTETLADHYGVTDIYYR